MTVPTSPKGNVVFPGRECFLSQSPRARSRHVPDIRRAHVPPRTSTSVSSLSKSVRNAMQIGPTVVATTDRKDPDQHLRDLDEEVKRLRDMVIRIADELLEGSLQREFQQRKLESQEQRHQQEVQAAALREGLMGVREQKEELLALKQVFQQIRTDVSDLASGLGRLADETSLGLMPGPLPSANKDQPRSGEDDVFALQSEMVKELSTYISNSKNSFNELRAELRSTVEAETEARTSLGLELRTRMDQIQLQRQTSLADCGIGTDSGGNKDLPWARADSLNAAKEAMKLQTKNLKETLAAVQKDLSCKPVDAGAADPELPSGANVAPRRQDNQRSASLPPMSADAAG